MNSGKRGRFAGNHLLNPILAVQRSSDFFESESQRPVLRVCRTDLLDQALWATYDSTLYPAAEGSIVIVRMRLLPRHLHRLKGEAREC